MNPRRIFADLLVFARGYFRNQISLFFSLAFPVIFMLLFGFIFSVAGSSTVTVYAENLDGSSNASAAFLQALNETGVVSVQLEQPSGNESLTTWLADNGHPVGIVIPSGFAADYAAHRNVTVTVVIDPQDPSSSVTVQGAVQGVISAFNLKAAKGQPIVGASTVQVGSPVYHAIDYLVPGLIGLSILTSPMFSMVEISSQYRKDGFFRQLSLTPLTKGEWLVAKIVWYVVITLMSTALMLVVGVGLFGAHTHLTAALLPYLVFGPFFFVSLGMLAGSITRTPESAVVLGNIITFPMMFLSGTFFPVSQFPAWLQNVAHFLPLYYVIDGMSQVMLFTNASRAIFDLALVVVGSAVVFVAAIVAFRWREA